MDLRGTIEYQKPSGSNWVFCRWDESCNGFLWKNSIDVFALSLVVEKDDTLFHQVEFIYLGELGEELMNECLKEWQLTDWHSAGREFFKEVCNGK